MAKLNEDWVNNLEDLHQKFKNAKPFSHVVIDNFFDAETVTKIMEEFPLPHENTQDMNWVYYNNPIENKYTINDFKSLPFINSVFDTLNSEDTICKLKTISGICNLEYDPFLHGAGIHAYPDNGKLDIHLDYSLHPFSGKERRLNLIVYLNKDWKEEYGGALELHDETFDNCVSLYPTFNTAVLFKTNNNSFHGFPKPLKCGQNNYRKSLANYYISEPTKDVSVLRKKAHFFPCKNQPVDEKLQTLYDIRKLRSITKEDLEQWPNWENEGNGYW